MSTTDRVAEALFPLIPSASGATADRMEMAERMARAAVRALHPPDMPKRRGRKPKPPGRSLGERISRPVTEADWELYFENREVQS